MSITIPRITAAAGVSAAIAGALYIGVQVGHPPADLGHLLSTDLLVRQLAKATMAVLALAGFAGMALATRHRLGRLGVVGYGLVSIGYLAMFATQVIIALVLPVVSRTSPGYVQDVLAAVMGGTPQGDIGALAHLFTVTGIGYSVGGLLFGIALFRTGVLARWACALFAVGTVSALALAVLPQSFSRPLAVPVGIALIGLGWSLWRVSPSSADEGVDDRPTGRDAEQVVAR